jgi:GT2 family glycosyltransferase
MKVSVVIPNYNGEELLAKNLPKVLTCQGINEVIIVDDASTDGSVTEIKNEKLKIKNNKVKLKIVANKKNLGFASTVNRGVHETTGELVVLLNTDVYPEKNFLQAAIPHFDNPQVFAVGFLQKCKEAGGIVLRGRGIGRFQRGFLIHARGAVGDKDTSDGGKLNPSADGESDDSSEVEDFKKTLWVSGGAGIFRKSIWEGLGGAETLYNPFYWEDIDLSYRALKAGFQLVFEPKSVVYHHQGEGAIKSTYSPFYIKTVAFRNQILFVWLNITDVRYLLAHFIFLPFHFIKSLIRGDWAFISGLFLVLQLIPLVVLRRQNTRLNKVGDSFLI